MDDKMYEIIALSFSETPLSDEDKALLLAWLETSSGNRDLYETFRAMYGSGEAFRKKGGSDRSLAWRKISAGSSLSPAIRSRRRIWKMAGIAAGLALLCAVGAGLLWRSSGYVRPENAIAFCPASGQVVLRLDNGKAIDLASDGSSVIVLEKGMEVCRDSNTLNYQANTPCPGNETEEYNTLVVPVGAEYRLVLSDGTRVHMNAASKLRYPAVFAKDRREVYLSGEAYFEVQRDTARRFVVKTADMDIRVLGTSFNVCAYPDAGVISATLVSGKISALCNGEEYSIAPGEQVRNNLLAGRTEVEEVNTALFTSWKDGYYYFEACRLEDILQTLSRWYGIHASFADPALKDTQFTGRLKRYEDIGQLFRKFEQTRNISFTRQGNNVTVSIK